jgi:hypothetical protein
MDDDDCSEIESMVALADLNTLADARQCVALERERGTVRARTRARARARHPSAGHSNICTALHMHMTGVPVPSRPPLRVYLRPRPVKSSVESHRHRTMNPKRTSSVQDVHTRKPPFGSRKVPIRQSHALLSHLTLLQPRFLTHDADVWSQNAWDHVPPPADQDGAIADSLARQHAAPVPDGDKHKYNTKPAKHWFVRIPQISTSTRPSCDP